MSIGRPSNQTGGEDKTVPADMLLLVGSAIVNEAILTGESTPQWKVLSFLNFIFVCFMASVASSNLRTMGFEEFRIVTLRIQ